MNQTRKNIKAYKAALPELRERVIAVALLLAMSMAMMTSATFAWITLSRAPEVTDMATNLAANGNLEIALVNPKGDEPGKSAVGDSSAAEGQTLVVSNLTWGNLINLNDPAYGLSNIILRPALLGDSSDLLNKPLKGVDYGEDGRVMQNYNEDYRFTSWFVPAGSANGYFQYYDTPQYGVRAISTVKREIPDSAYELYEQMLQKARGLQITANNMYLAIPANDSYMNAITTMIGAKLAEEVLNSTSNVNAQIPMLYNMVCDLDAAVEEFGKAMVALANVQIYNKYGMASYAPYVYDLTDPADIEAFFSSTTAELAANGISFPTVTLPNGTKTDALTAYKALKRDLKYTHEGTPGNAADLGLDYFMNNWTRDGNVTISQLLPVINHIVDINSCEMLIGGTTYKMSQLSTSMMGTLMKHLNDIEATITKGLMKDFEQLVCWTDSSDSKLFKENVKVSVSGIDVTAKVIKTSAAEPFLFNEAIRATEQGAASMEGSVTITAEDTYGMALDFWVRTNVSGSYLNLEGNVLVDDKEYVTETGLDANGNVVELYTVGIVEKEVATGTTGEDGATATTAPASSGGLGLEIAIEYTVYQDASGVWRYADSHAALYNEDGTAPEGQEISTPVLKKKQVIKVIGYEGENRVWQENSLLNVNSTTQGSGSCYIFYAEDPAQQESSLTLLKSMRVAFIDCTEGSSTFGKMVALAELDTEMKYETNGRVIVPLKLMDDGSSNLTKTEEGDLAILPLEKNRPTRLTALIFLDGRKLTNAEVQAANSIEGRLNIQFGSSELLENAGDEALELAERSVSAGIKKYNAETYGTSIINFAYDEATEENPMKVDLCMTVDGEQPNSLTAYFMRKVNDTQGSREELIEFERAGETAQWFADYTFTSPGDYVIRTVTVDGVDYDLPEDAYPQVHIDGFSLKSVILEECRTETSATILTDDRTATVNLSVEFKADQTKMPRSVQIQFTRENATPVTARLSFDPVSDKWVGTATFTTTGEYLMEFIILDNEFTALAEDVQRTLHIHTGLHVEVTDSGVTDEMVYKGQPFTVPVFVSIFDDANQPMRYLTGARLIYNRVGHSAVVDTDLAWNTKLDCYTGNLQLNGVGSYIFNCVSVGTNILDTAIGETPSYFVRSPNPPKYYDNAGRTEADAYKLSAGNQSQTIDLRLSDAGGVEAVYAIMTDSTGKEVATKIRGVMGASEVIGDVEVTKFSFAPPTNIDGYQDGSWKIVRVEVVGCYDSNSVFHGTDNPLVIDVKDKDLSVNILTVNIAALSSNLTKTDGVFMQTWTIGKPELLKVTDGNGNAVASSVSATYQYVANSWKTHGHYQADHLQDQTFEKTYVLAATDAQKPINFAPSEDIVMNYAGEYYCKSIQVAVEFGGKTYTLNYSSDSGADGIVPINMPKYVYKTAKPAVEITAITPTGSFSLDTANSNVTDTRTSGPNWIGTSKWTTSSYHKSSGYSTQRTQNSDGIYTSAKVYITCSHSGGNYSTTLWGGQKTHDYTPATVSITLSGFGNAEGASMTFMTNNADGNVRIYDNFTAVGGEWGESTNNNSDFVGYQWTIPTDGSTSVAETQYIGYVNRSFTGSDTKYPAGVLTSVALTFTYDGKSYTIQNVPTITITNEY